ncbi:MAG: hypothetical protein M1812_003287 [Candelaria pacifica]|nr:MAG: hypothetical protein M1812_003287 [Candelaria pacifica]
MPSTALKRDIRYISSRPKTNHLAKRARTSSYSTAQQERLWGNVTADPMVFGAAPPKPIREAPSQRPTKASAAVSEASNKLSSRSRGKPQPGNTKSLNSLPNRQSSQVLRGPPTRRRHKHGVTKQGATSEPREATSEIKDVNYILHNHKIPRAADYPGAPITLDKQPKSALHNGSNGNLKNQQSFSWQSPTLVACTLVCKLPEQEPFTTVGEGRNKKDAEKAAYLLALGTLHERDLLKDIFFSEKQDVVAQKTLKEEAEAKADIYNYAARFDSVPQFSVKTVVRPFRTRAKTVVEVGIELPEQNIKVAARGQNVKAADIAAAIRFKQEAEKYHAQHGEASIVIRDSEALNIGNAKNFLDFYKIENKSVRFTTSIKEVSGFKSFGSNPWEAQVLMNDQPLGEVVSLSPKKKAEDVAYLTASVALKKQNPDVFPAFQRALKVGNGEILHPVPPIDAPIDSDCILVMRETLYAARKAGLPDERDEVAPEEVERNQRTHSHRTLSPDEINSRSEDLSNRLRAYLVAPELEELRRKRSELPMIQYRKRVVEQVQNNIYSIIVGATGSGKTTQVPQILLEDAIAKGDGASCNVICTQPRRIAATSVARRVAEERNEPLQKSVGYQVRFDAKLPQVGGSVTYCTTGILLQQLQHSPDSVLDRTSHLIIDEVHERDIIIDFLLIILKKVVGDRLSSGKTVPRVVLMSATIDTELFAGYFKYEGPGGNGIACPTLSVPGRTFPVKENYLEDIMETLRRKYPGQQLSLLRSDPATRDYLAIDREFVQASKPAHQPLAGTGSSVIGGEAIIDWKRERVIMSEEGVPMPNEKEDAMVPLGLIATTVAHIAKSSNEGAILVFLPGLDEIVKVDELLRRQAPLGLDFTDLSRFKLSMLHSSIPAEQTDVFKPVPSGCRKVILATNIAETSVTIPDVQYVVDAGKHREKRYDQVRRITKLACTWISKSNSKQRAGRAGRVQNGNYYALFSKARFDSLRAIGLPEMLRSDLQEICLDIKAQAFKSPIREFLSEAIEPPPPVAVDVSVDNLQSLEALTDDEKLTPLGRLLASLPVHPALGKMIVLGIIFRCLDPMLILGATAAERSIFVNPMEAREEANRARLSFVEGTGSDHIALINAFRELRTTRFKEGHYAATDFARRKFLHLGAFKTVDHTACQIEDILVEAGLIPFTPPQKRLYSQLGDPSLNENSYKVPLVKALLVAGLHPNLAVNTRGRFFRTPRERFTMMHPSSINYPRGKGDENMHLSGTLLTYSTMAKANDGNSMFLRDTSEITPLMTALFGGRLQSKANILEMDGWLPFYWKGDFKAVKTILEFRKALDRLMAGAFQGLSKRDSQAQGFLADDRAREVFAHGLVDVFDRDVKTKDAVANRGWNSSDQKSKQDARPAAKPQLVSFHHTGNKKK